MKTFLLALAVAMFPSAISHAQIVQTYNYDANGRLVRVTRQAPAGNLQTNYTLDPADNRTTRAVAPVVLLSQAISVPRQAHAEEIHSFVESDPHRHALQKAVPHGDRARDQEVVSRPGPTSIGDDVGESSTAD